MTNPNTAPSADSDGGAEKSELCKSECAERELGGTPCDKKCVVQGEAVAPEAKRDVTDELILHRWDTHVGPTDAPTNADKIAFARAVLYETRAAAPPAPPAPLPGKENAFLSAVATIYIDPHDGRQELEYIEHIPRGELIRLYKAPNAVHADLLNVAIAVRDACHKAWVTSAENWRADVDVKSIVSAALSAQAAPAEEKEQIK